MSLRIGVMSCADVRNFGDVLLPLLVSAELRARPRNSEIKFITPTGTAWCGMPSRRFDQVDFTGLDAVLLGGGEVVHWPDDMLTWIYGRMGLDAIASLTDLVFGWTDTAFRYKAWLGLGIPDLAPGVGCDIAQASAGLHLLGVRGKLSRQRALHSGVLPGQIRLSPDLGWLFPRLLTGHAPGTALASGRPYIDVQALGFENPTLVSACLERFAERWNLQVVLRPLTRCWDDAAALHKLNETSRRQFTLVPDETGDLQKLALLGGAIFSVGPSMHGFSSTIDQGRPAGLVTADKPDKFQELLDDLRAPHLGAPDWADLEALMYTLVNTPLSLLGGHRADNEAALDSLFDEVCQAIACASGAQYVSAA